jgi:outer membrane protein OmpA-like peptidoglycan-associated protein
MKKAILILASAMMMGISVSAQEFNPHWYLQLRGGLAETIGETNFKDLLSPAADLSLGYQFTPAFGLRGNVMGWQAKGAISGVNGKTEVYKFNLAQAALDATFDICNIFNTNLDRVLSPYAYLGVGANARFKNDEAIALSSKVNAFEYLWDGTKFSPAGRAGLGFDIRLSDAIKLNLEAGVNALSDHFNSKQNERAKGPDFDYQYTGLVGLKIALGPTKKAAPAPVVVPPPAPAPAPAPAPKPEPKPEPKPVVVEQPAPAPELQENIYFIINKWDIQASEVAKLDEIAAFMAQNPGTKVQLTGHADKDTGTAQRNMFLSEKRAEVVTNELVKRGVDKSRISSTFKGDTANPFATPEENRVTVCFVK